MQKIWNKFNSILAEISSVTSEYSAIYTDGPKDGDRVASAAVFGEQVCSIRLPSVSSIFSAEATAQFFLLWSPLPLLMRVINYLCGFSFLPVGNWEL